MFFPPTQTQWTALDWTLLASLWIQPRKIVYMITDWSNYTPMLEVGAYFQMEQIDFSLNWWRAFWIIIHSISIFVLCWFLLFRRANQQALLDAHCFFCFWIILNFMRFGTASAFVATLINLGSITLMTIFAFVSETGYKLCLGAPALGELVMGIWLMLPSIN